MKHSALYLVMAGAILLMAGCGPEETPDPQNENPSFQLVGDQISVPAEGGEYTISVKSNVVWTVSVKDSWCTVSPSSGDGDAEVKVTVEANPDKRNDRSTRVLFTYNGITVTATVTQEKNPADFIFDISSKEINIGCGEETFEITVISEDLDYEITVVDEWLHEQGRSGNRVTGETITLWANANEWPEGRSGVISVCTKDGSCIPVMVNQAPGNPLYERNHLGFRFTATWCGYCPYMDEAFHKVAEQDSRFLYITMHASKGYPLFYDGAASLSDTYKVSGFPTGVLNGWKEIDNYTNTDKTAGNVLDAMNDFDAKFPCTAGIAIRTSIDGGNLDVEADVESGVEDDYNVVAFVTESGIIQAQTYYPTSGGSTTLKDFEHDCVARTVLTKELMGDAFHGEAGKQTSFHWNIALAEEWNPDNLNVTVYVYRPYGDTYSDYKAKRSYPNYWIVNARTVKAGENLEVEYAE